MILEQGTPGLSGRFVEAQHVFADTSLSDVDAESGLVVRAEQRIAQEGLKCLWRSDEERRIQRRR